jgi:hypothetical protein
MFGAFPAAYSANAEGKPLLSWRVHILPLLDHSELYKQFHLDEPWDSEHNRELIKEMPDVYRSPGLLREGGQTLYLGNAGPKGVFVAPVGEQESIKNPKGIPMRDIFDGTSNTIMVVHGAHQLATHWTRPGDFVYEDHEDLWNALAGPDGNGFQAVTCDGRGLALDDRAADRSVLTSLFTRNGGEPIP